MPPNEQAFGNSAKEKLPFSTKNQTRRGAAICHNQGVRGGKQDNKT